MCPKPLGADILYIKGIQFSIIGKLHIGRMLVLDIYFLGLNCVMVLSHFYNHSLPYLKQTDSLDARSEITNKLCKVVRFFLSVA